MHALSIKAVVNNPDGSLFYREEHEWTNLDDKMLTWFQGKLGHLQSRAQQLAGKGEDGANLSAVLTHVIDGTPTDVPVSGISYHALMKFEREFHKIGAELLDIGDDNSKGKGKAKGRGNS